MSRVTIQGLNEVRRNMAQALKSIDRLTVRGMRRATLYVEGESNEIVPQRFGVLLGSSFSDVLGNRAKGNIVGRVGYTAKYAPYVHEMPEDANFTKPDTGPKFLEKAMRNSQAKVLEILRHYASLGMKPK